MCGYDKCYGRFFFRIFNRRHVTLIVSFPFCSWRAWNKMVIQCLCRGVPRLIFLSITTVLMAQVSTDISLRLSDIMVISLEAIA